MRIVLINGLAGFGKANTAQPPGNTGFAGIIPFLPPQLVFQSIVEKMSGLPVGFDNCIAYLKAKEAVQNRSSPIRQKNPSISADTYMLAEHFGRQPRRQFRAVTVLTLAGNTTAKRQVLQTQRIPANPADYTKHSPDSSGNPQCHIRKYPILKHGEVSIVLESFGFKYGVPADLDFLFDVRVLPNPYYDKNLRNLTGRDEAVRRYFSRLPAVRQMVDGISGCLKCCLAETGRQNRIGGELTAGIGCTGGQHRSVFIAEAVAGLLHDYPIKVRHRHLPLTANQTS